MPAAVACCFSTIGSPTTRGRHVCLTRASSAALRLISGPMPAGSPVAIAMRGRRALAMTDSLTCSVQRRRGRLQSRRDGLTLSAAQLGDPGGRVKAFGRMALGAAVAVGALSGSAALAQDWPIRPVRIVNTFAPSGAADILARLAADHLSGAFGQQFFRESRAGAGGGGGGPFG